MGTQYFSLTDNNNRHVISQLKKKLYWTKPYWTMHFKFMEELWFVVTDTRWQNYVTVAAINELETMEAPLLD